MELQKSFKAKLGGQLNRYIDPLPISLILIFLVFNELCSSLLSLVVFMEFL